MGKMRRFQPFPRSPRGGEVRTPKPPFAARETSAARDPLWHSQTLTVLATLRLVSR